MEGMKHGLFLTIIFLATALFAAGCKSGGTSSANPVGTPAAGEDTLSTVTVERVANADSTIQCKFTLDYPTGNDSLSLAVRTFLHGELAKYCLPLLNDPDAAGKYPLYNGKGDNGETVAGYYADGTLVCLKQMAKEMFDEGSDGDVALEFDLSLAKVADTTRYVSYEVKLYTYLGGAHGSSAYCVVNIAKPSGKVLTQTVDTLQLKALQPILRKGVMEFLNGDGTEEVTEANLNDHLFLTDGIIPLPVRAPYLAADGVHFVYQQYEIGPYAIGLVSFTVPYAEIRQYLTREALQLIE